MPETDEHAQRRRRLIRLSKINGWSVTVIAGGFALLSLFSLSWAGVFVGAVATGSGVMEIRGHRRLEAGRPGARGLMVGSQVMLVLCVLLYCAWRLASFDPEDPLAIIGSAEVQIRELAELGFISMSELEAQVAELYSLTYRLVAVLTLVVQGGFGFYYWVQVGRVHSAPDP